MEERGEVEEKGSQGQADRLEGAGAGRRKGVQHSRLITVHPVAQGGVAECIAGQAQSYLYVGRDGWVCKGCCQGCADVACRANHCSVKLGEGLTMGLHVPDEAQVILFRNLLPAFQAPVQNG